MTQTILIIEDEKELRELLREELTSQGYRVEMATNGQEGLDRLQDLEPDLIICDRSMPVMTGFELLDRIRGAYPQYKALPFIFLTALSDLRDKHSVSHLQPTAYLEKPIDFEKLSQTVKNALKS